MLAGFLGLLAVVDFTTWSATPQVPGSPQVGSERTAARLHAVAGRGSVPGYDRDCGPGRGCVFGPPWSDDVDVTGGHDGCDTRNQILKASMHDVVTKPGTRGCVVLAGVLTDPYTGEPISFTRAAGAQVSIDHVYPLAAAWDMGAASWDAQRRRDFANDPRNLVATARAVNAAKSDKTPQSWAPPTATGRCLYARRYVAVASAYGLGVTGSDLHALREGLRSC